MLHTSKTIVNTLTHNKIVQAIPQRDEIVIHEDAILITETDKRGIITYANRKYIDFSGFSKRELIGAPHNIVRHPDMPEGLFVALWKIISQKKTWRGYIKSLCKDGKFFWALTYVQAKLDDNGEIIGYRAARKMAYEESLKEVEEQYYLLQGKKHIGNEYFMRSKSYDDDSVLYYALLEKEGKF
jgi:aerotaxis receptor